MLIMSTVIQISHSSSAIIGGIVESYTGGSFQL